MSKKLLRRIMVLVLTFSVAVGGAFSPVVSQAATRTGLSTKTISVEKGKSKTIRLLNAGTKGIKWSCSKTGVVTVKAKGSKAVITGKKPGRAVVSAKLGKKTYKCVVKVTLSPKSIKLSKTSLELKVKGKATLKATLAPAGVTEKTVTWKSSNTKVATVSKTGVVTGVKAGTATISATTSNGKKAVCKVTVKAVATATDAQAK